MTPSGHASNASFPCGPTTRDEPSSCVVGDYVWLRKLGQPTIGVRGQPLRIRLHPVRCTVERLGVGGAPAYLSDLYHVLGLQAPERPSASLKGPWGRKKEKTSQAPPLSLSFDSSHPKNHHGDKYTTPKHTPTKEEKRRPPSSEHAKACSKESLRRVSQLSCSESSL